MSRPAIKIPVERGYVGGLSCDEKAQKSKWCCCTAGTPVKELPQAYQMAAACYPRLAKNVKLMKIIESVGNVR